MESFKEYVISEYRVENYTSVSFKFTHTATLTVDKKTEAHMYKHTINVAIKFYDKDMALLDTHTLKFVNNELNKKQAGSLVNIAPKELENRFNAARRDIVREIQNEYLAKRRDIEDKIDTLRWYENVNVADRSVIPSEFKGVKVQAKDSVDKKVFDM